jgi:hypothetical protein
MADASDIARFRRIAPEHLSVPEAELDGWFEDAAVRLGDAAGWSSMYSLALAEMTAHMITMAQRGERKGGGLAGATGLAGQITSVSVEGDVVLSANDPSAGIDPALRVWLSATHHGQAVLSYMLNDDGGDLPMVVTPC